MNFNRLYTRKKYRWLWTSVILFSFSNAHAHLLSITTSAPFPDPVSTSSTHSATYTITNIASQVAITAINQSQFPRDSGLTMSSSTCGSSLNPGQSCSMTLTLHAPTAPQTINTALKVWAKPSADGVQYPIVINVTVPPAVVSAIAVGTDLNSALPLIVRSNDNAVTWEAVPIAGAPSGELAVVRCSGNGENTVCMAAGVNHSTPSNSPLLAVSSGNGNWTIKNVSGLTADGSFCAGSCTGSGANAICIAAGEDTSSVTAPLLAVSTNGAQDWTIKNVTGSPTQGTYCGATCVGESTTATCVSVGENFTDSAPLIAVSNNGGNTWTAATLPGSLQGDLESASCIRGGNSTRCVAVGTDISSSSSQPLIMLTTNNGNSWSKQSINSLPSESLLKSVSCTGSGSSAICVAVGEDLTSSAAPLIVLSTNGGNTWTVKTIPALPSEGILYSASCTGSGTSAICIAVGIDSTSSQALVMQSTDGGNTWTRPVIPSLPSVSILESAHCTGSGTHAICIAAGQNLSGSAPPLLVSSQDGGASWTIPTIAGLPSTGRFKGCGTT